MNLETFRSYCLSKKGTDETFPFPKLPTVLVFKVMGKMFAVTDQNDYTSVVLKFATETIEDFKEQHSALSDPPYFSSKHWCNVALDGSLREEEIFSFIDTSYDLIVKKLTKKQKAELDKL